MRLVSRTTQGHRVGGTYMLQNVQKFSYVVGVSASRTADHRSVIEELAAAITSGGVRTPKAAQEWVGERLGRA